MTLKKLLKGSKDITAERLAAAMAKNLLKDEFKSGLRLPIQSKVKQLAKTRMSVVQTAWAILLDYGLIQTKKGAGTFLITERSSAQIEKIDAFIWRCYSSYYDMIFDSSTLPVFDSPYDEKVMQALASIDRLPKPDLAKKTIPALSEEFAKLISGVVGYPFTAEEVYYSDYHSELIVFALEANCSHRLTVAIITPISAVEKIAMKKSHRKLRTIGLDSSLNVLDELDELCQNGKIGLVYLGPTAPLPLMNKFDQHEWDKLCLLQQKYGFKIIQVISLAGWVYFPPLLENKQGRDASVIIIMKVSALHLLSDVTIIAGPKESIQKIEMKYYKRDRQLPVAKAYALLWLLKHELRKHELEAYDKMKSLCEEAKKILLAPDIFKPEYIQNQQGWEFYLELKSGSFPGKIYTKFSNNHFHIFHPDYRPVHPDFKNGIILSIANYMSSNVMAADLGKFIKEIIRTKK